MSIFGSSRIYPVSQPSTPFDDIVSADSLQLPSSYEIEVLYYLNPLCVAHYEPIQINCLLAYHPHTLTVFDHLKNQTPPITTADLFTNAISPTPKTPVILTSALSILVNLLAHFISLC
jgi:hypothetical protein